MKFIWLLILFLIISCQKDKPYSKIEELEKIELLRILPNEYFSSVVFTKDYLIGGCLFGKIIFLKLPSFSLVWETTFNDGRGTIIKVVNDTLLIVGREKSFSVININKKESKKILEFKKRLWSVDYAPRKNLFAIGLEDGEVLLIDDKEFKIYKKFKEKRLFKSLIFPDGEYLLINNKIINIEKEEIVKTLDCNFVKKSFDNEKYLLGIKRDSLIIYNLKNWEKEVALLCLSYNLTDAEVIFDNKYLLYSRMSCFGGANEIYIIDLKEGKYLKKIKLPDWPLSLTISKDNNYLAVATPKGIFIYSLSDIFR